MISGSIFLNSLINSQKYIGFKKNDKIFIFFICRVEETNSFSKSPNLINVKI